MSNSLLATKLYRPPQRPNLVARPRLLARLTEARRHHHRLTLVSAPAGYGKTTLVSSWLESSQCPSVWVSLDEGDNDPRRFLRYLVAALNQVGIEIGPKVLSQLAAPPWPEAEALAADLINEVVASSVTSLLVLDDYHLIHNEWVHQIIEFTVEYQPPEMHLVLVTRVDPPLPLARWRGRGLLTEIRDHDLRFTVEEAAQFLAAMNLDPTPEAIATLERRTEGWIVGLQMAAISMQGRQHDGDLDRFIEAFGGTNRFVLDYLTEEVLAQQPPAIQAFIVETSILSRMCADLCDAVRQGGPELPGDGSKESLSAAHSSQAILAQLERNNIFLMPLDDERRWYRYHHLFADLIQSTLKQHRSEAQIREYHRRASRWYEAEGALEEAMIHTMAAQDFERAAAMIDENIASMLSRSEAPVLLGWIEKLPETVVRGRPWIDINRAFTLALSGKLEQVGPLLQDVEDRIEPHAPRASELLGNIAALRAYAANLRANVGRAVEMGELAVQCLPDKHLNAQAMAAYALADTYFAIDDTERASQASQRMLKVGEQTGRLLMAIPALCDLAAVKKVQGKLHQAQTLYDRAWHWMAERVGLDSRVRCPHAVGVAGLQREWNQLDAAHEQAVTGIEYCRRYGVYSILTSGYLCLMRILLAQGHIDGALDALQRAQQNVQTHHHRMATQIEFQTARAQLSLALGDGESAEHWCDQFQGHSELEQITRAHLWLFQGRPSEAHQLLEQQRALAEAGGRTGRLIQITSLQAWALEALGCPAEAEATLSQVLLLAAPEGMMRVFLDLGQPLAMLLARLARSDDPNTLPLAATYAQTLRDAMQRATEMQGRPSLPKDPLAPALTRPLPEPLTPRELEVLHLLSHGLSNKEIARRLVVATSTVKQHLKNIYGKLDVHSRTQAVARGRELEIL